MILTSTNFLLVRNLSIQITSIRIVHDNAKTALVHKGFLIGDNIWMTHRFQHMDLY